MMSSLTTLVIKHRLLKADLVFKEATCEPDGAWFACMSKCTSPVKKLLCAKVDPQRKNNSLAGTDIIEQLMTLISQAVAAFIQARIDSERSKIIDEIEALGIEETDTMNDLGAEVVVPKVIDILGPSFPEFNGITMRVYTEKTKTLWIELTPVCIDYLMDAVAFQLRETTIAMGPSDAPYQIPGATWCSIRKSYKVSALDGDDKPRYKYIKVKDAMDKDAIESQIAMFKTGHDPSSSEQTPAKSDLVSLEI